MNEIQNKTNESFRVKLFSFKDGNELSIPSAVVGKGEGPIIILIAALHGNELNGVYINHMVFESLSSQEISGKIIFLPIANPLAYVQKSRVASIDYIDMNRTFSFVKKRKPTEHLAHLLFDNIITHADIVFDLHTGGPGEYMPVVEAVSEMAMEEAFHINLGTYMLREKESGSLVSNCDKHGIVAFSVEMGSAHRINQEYCHKFLEGLKNYLIFKGMLEGDLKTLNDQHILTGKIMVPANRAGFFFSEVHLGQTVVEGEVIGRIEILFQEKAENVIAPGSGKIIYLRVDESVGQGDSLAHIAY